jgi:hypothetical protein
MSKRMQGALALVAALAASCATEIRSLDADVAADTGAAEHLPAIAAIAAAEPRTSVPRLTQSAALERFAARLAAAGLFDEIQFPASELANPKAGLWIHTAIDARYERHWLRNLASDWLVGLSVLTLQPLLPSIADLCVEIRWEAQRSDAQRLHGDSAVACNRIESTWLRVPEADVAKWHDETLARAIDRALLQIAGARDQLVATAASSP